MSIYNDPKLDILAWVNKKTGVTFLQTDLIFSTPKANAQGVTPNTKLRVTVSNDHPDYNGTVVIDYHRLVLSNLANFPVPDYPPTAVVGASVYSLLQKIRDSMGIYFTQDDLEETFVTDNGSHGEVLLKAKDTSLGWVGEFPLLLGGKRAFSTLFRFKQINWS